jgi:hypothetical protein
MAIGSALTGKGELMNAQITLDVPEWQIGQEVTVYFPDTMQKKGKCELLKEQEEEEAEIDGSGMTWFFVCGNCHTTLADHAKYCHQCGKKVKWT